MELLINRQSSSPQKHPETSRCDICGQEMWEHPALGQLCMILLVSYNAQRFESVRVLTLTDVTQQIQTCHLMVD